MLARKWVIYKNWTPRNFLFGFVQFTYALKRWCGSLLNLEGARQNYSFGFSEQKRHYFAWLDINICMPMMTMDGSFTSKLTHCRSIWLTFLPKRLLAIWIGEWTVYVYTLYPSSTPARIYLTYSLYQPWSPQFTVEVDFYLLAIMARHLAFAGCNYGLVLIHSCIPLNFC